jgi:ADP-heptose:LPS heptosyltransferase
VLIHNPYIDKLFTIKKEISEIQDKLIEEDYDYILDLHHNLRSKRLIARLRKPVMTFNKLNYEKWLKVNLKMDILPPVHIVERYMDTVSFWNIKYDGKGLDYFISDDDERIFADINIKKEDIYNVFVIGGAHYTKQIPDEIITKIGKAAKQRIVLLGGKEDSEKAKIIQKSIGENCIDLCGKLSINQSAAVVKHCKKILTPDTGLMHIAAAFKKEIVSVWGNTIPDFGMYALLPVDMPNQSFIFEVKNLKCRPCSKIGFKKCPKKHFDCMYKQDIEGIINRLNY